MTDTAPILLRPGGVIDALGIAFDHTPYPADRTMAGEPASASVDLCDVGGDRIGVWELTRGTVVDTEDEELFVVLSGSGIIEFHDSGDLIHLHPGSVVRLAAGARTTWTVTETLRKVYVGPVG